MGRSANPSFARVQHSSGWRRREILSAFSVEAVDEEAMTTFMRTSTCRRKVLGEYFDQKSGVVDCISTDSVFCDQCKVSNGPGVRTKQEEHEEEHGREQEARPQPNGRQIIAQQLRALQESHETMIKVMDQLQGQCIYCGL